MGALPTPAGVSIANSTGRPRISHDTMPDNGAVRRHLSVLACSSAGRWIVGWKSESHDRSGQVPAGLAAARSRARGLCLSRRQSCGAGRARRERWIDDRHLSDVDDQGDRAGSSRLTTPSSMMSGATAARIFTDGYPGRTALSNAHPTMAAVQLLSFALVGSPTWGGRRPEPGRFVPRPQWPDSLRASADRWRSVESPSDT
jgi:hypothetical protein